MTDAQQPLVIKDFQKAVADSPHIGHALMRNINIENFPGAMQVKTKMLSMLISCVAQTFTANAGTDVCTTPADNRTQAEIDAAVNFNGAAVQFTTTGTLPAGLSLNTTYFLIYVSNTTFKVASTLQGPLVSGSWIDITDTGTGVHTVTPIAMGTVNHIVKHTTLGYYFAVDSNGRVWFTHGSNSAYLLNGNTITGAAGNGLAIFRVSDGSKTWLFVYRNAAIDLIEVTSDTPIFAVSWTNSWKSMNSGSGSGNPHHSIVAQDNIIYFTDDRWIGSTVENAGSVFDPATAGTYTYNNQALDTPQGEILGWLCELGVNLLAAGQTYNKVYPWDRISDSFALPLEVPETKVMRIKNLGGVIYILAGTKGNIYYSQGTYVKFFKAVPGYLTNNGTTNTSSPLAWGGIASANGALIFGVSTVTSGNSGIYKLFPDGRILHDNTPYGGSQQVAAIYAENDFYYTGYAGGFDYTDTSRYAAGTFTAVFQSELFRVGTVTGKGTFSQLEVQMPKPASSGQIRVSYRRDDSSSFTTLATFTTDGVATSFQSDIGIIDIENIQVQVEFDGNTEPFELTLYP